MEKPTSSPGLNQPKKKNLKLSSESAKWKKLKRPPPAIENNDQMNGGIDIGKQNNKKVSPSVLVKDDGGHGNPRGDGLCRSCMEDLLSEMIPRAAENVVKKMKKPVSKDEKLKRKFKETRLAQLSALEKHADFLKTNAKLLFLINTVDVVVEDSCDDDV